MHARIKLDVFAVPSHHAGKYIVCLRACLLIVFLMACLTGRVVEAKEQSAALNGKVEPGTTYAVRLRNLPKGATLAVELETSDVLVVWLLGEESFKAFPSTAQPLFQGKTSGKLEFSLRIPESGHYFIVLDNRAHDKNRNFSLGIKAAAQ